MRPIAVLGMLIGVAFAACGGDDQPAPSPSASARVAVVSPTDLPTAHASSTPRPLPTRPASDDTEIWGIILSATARNISPVLRPAALPDGFETVSIPEPADRADAYSFIVEYSGPGKWLRIGAGAFNPPPAGPGGFQQQVQIRGLQCTPDKGRDCVLQVKDSANPKDGVWLWWNEPGEWLAEPGEAVRNSVFYLVSAHGVEPTDVMTTAESLLPAAARPCGAGDLNAILGATMGMTGGQIVAAMLFGNKSDTPCSLEGVPQVQLVDAGGGTPAVEVFSLCETEGIPCSPRQTVILAPGTGDLDPRESRPGRAIVPLSWPTHVQGRPCSPAPGPVIIRVILADGALDVKAVYPCGRLGVGWFIATGP